MTLDFFLAPLRQILDLGGPVVAVLAAVSVLTLAVVLFKIVQFRRAGVGRHKVLRQSLAQWDRGEKATARTSLGASQSYLAPLARSAMAQPGADGLTDRLEADAEAHFLRLERGFRLLDGVAQLAPLMGLFGTVLGMIEAFQSLQSAGSQVDPSLLAGGIWVALLTTAVGLAVAMPTQVILSWLEARMDAERVIAAQVITTIVTPQETTDA